MSRHVVVLKGGLSEEREVSLATGAACAEALQTLGFRVTEIDALKDFPQKLVQAQPDVVFNALHGGCGEDGCVSGLLEVLGLPYTHSGVLASALCMHKERAKQMLSLAGFPVAEGVLATRHDVARRHVIPPPYVVKPLLSGSSFGVIIVREGASPPEITSAHDWSYGEHLIVERYIPGKELTCGALDGPEGPEVWDVIEIHAEKNDFYDYRSKYDDGGSQHTLPAKIKPIIYQSVREMTLKAHQIFGCRGVSRMDFRYDPKSDLLVCLEINTHPGMTKTSLAPEMARYAGTSFASLMERLVVDAGLKK